MKVEKINNYKAVIILTTAELAKRKITINDIKEGTSNVQDFFFEVLESLDFAQEFTNESSQLFVEVSTSENDVFMITLTKADCLPELTAFPKAKRINYTVSSSIYSFSSLKQLYDFCKKALEENLYVGLNSLYELNDKYYLMFSNTTIKKSGFVKTFSVISEYADKYFSKHAPAFLEYAKQLIPKDAIQTLQNI